MYKQLLAITLSAFILTACGGSDDGGGGNNNNNGTPGGDTSGGTTPGTTTPGGTDGETVSGPVPTGVSGDFGDAGSADNAIAGVYTLCPANTESFSVFAEVGGEFCVPGCPAVFENDDDDPFGSILADNGDRFTCFITDNAPGSQVEVFFSAPINGCPASEGGCAAGTFPPVFISAAAGSNELAGTYNCADWLFDVDAQDWGSALTTPAPFPLTLNADGSADINGTPTTWTFATGVLTLEGNRIFTNVAVGNGSFTQYRSNTSITRCTS